MKLFFYNSVDLKKKSNIHDWYKLVKKRTDEIEIIINCAAIPGNVDSFSKLSDRVWRNVFDINFFGIVNNKCIFTFIKKIEK